MHSFRIAVLSDFHVGDSARASDLCPSDYDDSRKVHMIESNYCERFLAFISDEGIKAQYLVLPGDMTNEAQPSEVRLASEVVLQIADQLGVKESDMVFVPGNHDVDWKVLELGKDPVRLRQRFDPISADEFIFSRVMSGSSQTLVEEPYLTAWELDDLLIVGFNSSWHDNPDELLHYGRIDDGQLSALEDLLDRVDLSQEKLRIFLIHHHPITYSNPAPGRPDFSQLVNSERLLEILGKRFFDVIVHGHIHQPRFRTHEIDASTPIGILSAGSFSFSLPREWDGCVTNQFHLICVNGRSGDTNLVEGYVRSWAYFYAHGWIPSDRERDGIAHREPFGQYENPHLLRDSLKACLSDLFSTSSWVDWSGLVAVLPSVEYMRPDRVVDALDALAEELGFRIHDRTPERLVLLKELTK